MAFLLLAMTFANLPETWLGDWDELEYWLARMELYFYIHKVPEENKVTVALILVDGRPIDWIKSELNNLLLNRQDDGGILAQWDKFKDQMRKIFGEFGERRVQRRVQRQRRFEISSPQNGQVSDAWSVPTDLSPGSSLPEETMQIDVPLEEEGPSESSLAGEHTVPYASSSPQPENGHLPGDLGFEVTKVDQSLEEEAPTEWETSSDDNVMIGLAVKEPIRRFVGVVPHPPIVGLSDPGLSDDREFKFFYERSRPLCNVARAEDCRDRECLDDNHLILMERMRLWRGQPYSNPRHPKHDDLEPQLCEIIDCALHRFGQPVTRQQIKWWYAKDREL